MSKFLDINGYLASVEQRFSGANGRGYDTTSGFDNNMNLDLSFDGQVPVAVATPAMANLKQASPYAVNVVNSTAGTLTAILFGENQYLLTTNFGSATGITITCAMSNVSYTQLLRQSASQPFETSLIRISTTNATQLTQILTITSNDANGQLCQIPLITQNYFSAMQFQSTILDIPFGVRIDGTTNIQFSVLANTTVSLTFFPSNKANISRDLNGQPTLQQYASPNIALASTPVYVNPGAFARALGN